MKAAIFDLDDTLYNYRKIHPVAMERVFEYVQYNIGISKTDFNKAYEIGKKSTKENMSYDCASQHNRIIYFQKTLEVLGMNPIKYTLALYDVYWNTMLELMQLNDGVIELLKYLRSKNIKIAICTDLTTHIQHRKLIKLELVEYIYCLVTSEEAGLEKPNQVMFNLCLEKLGVEANESFYIGDSFKKDILGAYYAGITPIWLNEDNKIINEDNIGKYEEGQNINDITNICKRLLENNDEE
ncbi:HAD family hydrolase [Clostridium butyricum]|uniref:HAD family hydrolase n=1 Tax=Clostridium butyricum TaxID=1492 RepID=UPI00374F211E